MTPREALAAAFPGRAVRCDETEDYAWVELDDGREVSLTTSCGVVVAVMAQRATERLADAVADSPEAALAVLTHTHKEVCNVNRA